MSLDEHFYEGRTIATIWKENNWIKDFFPKMDGKCDIDKVADKIIRKFSEILNTIGFSKEEINWYKSDSANGEGGKFIFNGDDVAFEMKELFEIFGKVTIPITSEERDKTIEHLTNILPVLRSEKDVKDVKKIAKKTNREEERRRFSEPASLISCTESYLEKFDDGTQKARIEEIVCNYFVKDIDIRIGDLFEKKIFVKANKKDFSKKTLQGAMYEYQYGLVKKWKQKFDILMQMTERIRVAERFQNLYNNRDLEEISQADIQDYCKAGETDNGDLHKLCQEMEWIEKSELYRALLILFKNGECLADKEEKAVRGAQEELVRTEKECLEKCIGLVTATSKHSLRETSKEDFYYIMNYALEELELITAQVKEKQMEQSYCLQLNRSEADFEILEQVREQVRIIENRDNKYALADRLGVELSYTIK